MLERIHKTPAWLRVLEQIKVHTSFTKNVDLLNREGLSRNFYLDGKYVDDILMYVHVD